MSLRAAAVVVSADKILLGGDLLMWVYKMDSDIFMCSECGNEAYWDTDYGQQLFDYCPYCGAYNRLTREQRKVLHAYESKERV